MSEQKKTRPKAEEAVSKLLSGETQKNALDFISFMKDNKLSLGYASNSWKSTYKGKSVCYLLVHENEWTLRFSHFTREKWFVDYDCYIIEAKLKDFIVNNINPRNCPGRDCGASKSRTILGKNFDEVCTCWPLYLKNLSGEDIEYIKKYILVIKKYIADLPVVDKK